MSHHYIVSVQQPSTVTHCIKGHFLSPSSLDVIVAKVSKLELYSVSESGLSPVYEVPIYGRIAALCKYCSSRRCDHSKGKILTVVCGNIRNKTGRSVDISFKS
ncbi:DNA damage-binding protein 1-like protein [Blastocystis sp. subtype 4]|uniref:DNA damage-binding protein 1-like protein n=1 Tax=Blastocystis sp. subtype 4 TaxID=944170 RepID=UPI000711CE0D|nr:DNA damage-binding protein 1-like protein [Blastocystis sp. subtype 4]KNB43544.1 DNA damage-binding protein 1-like protein [Blastocystis sp. subtype 4]|eukprot:XP_014526987.1 DNA damage-binding protein 1-like protein [Blastocystis sp. subtype 4]